MRRSAGYLVVIIVACGGSTELNDGRNESASRARYSEIAGDGFVPHPLCANNPIGSASDPSIGIPNSAALNQLSPSGTMLRIGLATTNPHYAAVINGVPVGPGIDMSCRLGVRLNLPIDFKFYGTLPDFLAGFRANPPEFEIGWAFDPSLADPDLVLTNPYVAVPNTYAVAASSTFLQVADVDVPRDPPVKIGAMTGNSPAVYLARNLKFAKLLTFTGAGAQTALLAGTIDAVASGRTALTTFANQNSTKVRILPDNIFYAMLAPFLHRNNPDGVCYLNHFLEAAKASGLVLQALSRTNPSVLAGGSKVADPMPICAPTARCHDVTVPADDSCQGNAAINAGSSDDDSDADCAQDPAAPYALGATQVTLTCVDRASQQTSSCTGTVTVVDTTPPVVTVKPADTNGFIASFWPPDRTLQTVSLSDCIASVKDQCDGSPRSTIVRVTADESVTAHGNKSDDMAIVDSQTVLLRADRDGSGDGRVYTIFGSVTDDVGNATPVSCKVQVPHDRSGAQSVDSGRVSCVGEGC